MTDNPVPDNGQLMLENFRHELNSGGEFKKRATKTLAKRNANAVNLGRCGSFFFVIPRCTKKRGRVIICKSSNVFEARWMPLCAQNENHSKKRWGNADCIRYIPRETPAESVIQMQIRQKVKKVKKKIRGFFREFFEQH